MSSLIEQAVAELSEQRVVRRRRQPSTGDVSRVVRQEGNEPNSATFTLDTGYLAKQGFLTPHGDQKRLALELRAIKRRLLRRLSFYKLENEKQSRRARHGRQKNTVLFTSTRPAEGKTFNAVNLALSLAIEDNINVLLIDADVPRPKVCAHLGLESGKGLTDRVMDPSLEISDLLQWEKTYPLSVMSEGSYTTSGTEIFSTAEMAGFIEEISQRYPDRLIIFDAPPVLATPDAVVLAKHVDEVVFVVEANETPEPAVAAALDEVLDSNTRVSLVLNKCLVAEGASEYGSYAEYYARDDVNDSRKGRVAKRRDNG
jgi:Mrp family chromosome partitioning ATPase